MKNQVKLTADKMKEIQSDIERKLGTKRIINQYTLNQVAQIIGKTRQYAWILVRSGRLPALRVGNNWMVSKVNVWRYLEWRAQVEELNNSNFARYSKHKGSVPKDRDRQTIKDVESIMRNLSPDERKILKEVLRQSNYELNDLDQ